MRNPEWNPRTETQMFPLTVTMLMAFSYSTIMIPRNESFLGIETLQQTKKKLTHNKIEFLRPTDFSQGEIYPLTLG